MLCLRGISSTDHSHGALLVDRGVSLIRRASLACISSTDHSHGALLVDRGVSLNRELGVTFRALAPWQIYVITSHPEFGRLYGARPDKVRKLYNGMIPCYLYQYFKNK